MMVYTACCCLLSMIPYAYLNLRGGSSLSLGTRWTLPAVRAVGGFLTATMMQLIIQRRITTLCRQWLSIPDHGNAGDPPCKGGMRMYVPGSDKRGEGLRASHHDLERGSGPTGTSRKDNSSDLGIPTKMFCHEWTVDVHGNAAVC